MNIEDTTQMRCLFQRYRYYNAFKYIPWLNQPQNIIRKYCTKDTLKKIKNAKFLEESAQEFRSKTLCLFDVKDTFAYKHFIPIFCELLIDIPAIMFCKSAVTDQIVSEIRSWYWVGRHLVMAESNVEKLISGKFAQNIFGRLKILDIKCDPIGNKGIKKLMQISTKNLAQFQLSNTKCTSDVIKMLKKKEKLQNCIIEINTQHKFDFLRLNKQCMHFKITKNEIPFVIQMTYYKFKDSILYPGHLSKIYNEGDKRPVIIKNKDKLGVNQFLKLHMTSIFSMRDTFRFISFID